MKSLLLFLLVELCDVCSFVSSFFLDRPALSVRTLARSEEGSSSRHRHANRINEEDGLFSYDQRTMQPPGASDASVVISQPKDGPNLTFPAKLIHCLDLVPLIEGVSRHAATRRGRDSMLKLIGGPNKASDQQVNVYTGVRSRGSRRKALASMVDARRSMGDTVLESFNSTGAKGSPDTIDIVEIAQSASQAMDEYELIRQATIALQSERKAQEQKCVDGTSYEGTEKDILSIPPIYGASSSPWDLNEVDTDDDEWLSGVLGKDGCVATLELENILQADQIGKRLIKTKNWADMTSTRRLASGLSTIANQINANVLEDLQEEISDAVQVVRTRSVSDPTGARTYSFRLNAKKYPSLGLLRKKEFEIVADMDNYMQELLRNKSFASNLVGKRGAEAFELRGRLVIPTPRNVATSIGVIRGFSKKGGTCYVEPKAIIEKGDELSEIRAEIDDLEKQITQHLVSAIVQAAPFIESGMKCIARIDTIFARAAYGLRMNGVIPMVGNQGKVQIDDFVHPVLAGKHGARKDSSMRVVPIDLNINDECRSLVISGPNGGGKTVALKSFGLAAIMCKLAVPIPVNFHRNNRRKARIDFFRDIFVEVGDQQSVSEGESTLMARLNACAEVIQKMDLGAADTSAESTALASDSDMHTLILLDELGGGTDPEAGSALARAILEKILECKNARTVSTTHSPQLKALSFNDERFNCATVLLDIENDSPHAFKLPTFKLAYGSIGDSYALGAASRCTPSLPDDVLQRASDILAGGEGGNGDVLRAIASSLEREREAAEISARAADELRKDTFRCRGAVVSLARAYEEHLSRLESRLDRIFNDLRQDESKNAYELVGETLAELRHVKKRIKNEQELLAERGLKMVPVDYEFKDGETVVIVAKGQWDGQTAVVSLAGNGGGIEGPVDEGRVVVIPSYDWGSSLTDYDGDSQGARQLCSLSLKRSEIALWDYPDPNWDDGLQGKPIRSVSNSKQRLFDVISNLSKSDETPAESAKPVSESKTPSYKSSRERRAAAATAKKEKKRAKKKKK